MGKIGNKSTISKDSFSFTPECAKLSYNELVGETIYFKDIPFLELLKQNYNLLKIMILDPFPPILLEAYLQSLWGRLFFASNIYSEFRV